MFIFASNGGLAEQARSVAKECQYLASPVHVWWMPAAAVVQPGGL